MSQREPTPVERVELKFNCRPPARQTRRGRPSRGCGAEPGVWCVKSDGTTPAPTLHSARYDRALATGALPIPEQHALVSVQAGENVATWLCQCGSSGATSRSHAGEDLEFKAKGNHRQHARKRS